MAKMVNVAKISPILPTKFLVIEGPNTCDQIEFYVFHSCLLEFLKNAGYIPVPAVYVYNNLEIRVLTGSFGRPQLRSPNKVAKWIKAESKCNIKMFEWNQRIS